MLRLDSMAVGVANTPGACAPVSRNSVAEELGAELARAMAAISPAGADPNQLVVTFPAGRLQGLTCALAAAGTKISCRLRTDSAVLRQQLCRAHPALARKLAVSGLVLAGYEVMP